jgi:hypothetical protein
MITELYNFEIDEGKRVADVLNDCSVFWLHNTWKCYNEWKLFISSEIYDTKGFDYCYSSILQRIADIRPRVSIDLTDIRIISSQRSYYVEYFRQVQLKYKRALINEREIIEDSYIYNIR